MKWKRQMKTKNYLQIETKVQLTLKKQKQTPILLFNVHVGGWFDVLINGLFMRRFNSSSILQCAVSMLLGLRFYGLRKICRPLIVKAFIKVKGFSREN